MMVDVIVKADCGNAPRKFFLHDYYIALVNHDIKAILDGVADDIQWDRVGKGNVNGKVEFEHILEEIRDKNLELVSIDNFITHGKVASVNGNLTYSQGVVYGFCDVYTFTSHAKDAKIKAITSYLMKRSPK